MSLLNIFDVAASALKAQSIRLDTISSNMANAQVVSSSEEGAYKVKLPIFSTLYESGIQGNKIKGVEVQDVVESQAPVEASYAPNHPMANEEGLIYKSNVNMVQEMANMISASRSYTSNVEVMNTSKQLLLRTLRIGS